MIVFFNKSFLASRTTQKRKQATMTYYPIVYNAPPPPSKNYVITFNSKYRGHFDEVLLVQMMQNTLHNNLSFRNLLEEDGKQYDQIQFIKPLHRSESDMNLHYTINFFDTTKRERSRYQFHLRIDIHHTKFTNISQVCCFELN